jgi:hypothetical protein
MSHALQRHRKIPEHLHSTDATHTLTHKINKARKHRDLFALQVRETVMLHMPDSLPARAAHSEHQEVWAISNALKVHSLLLPGVQDPPNQCPLQSSTPFFTMRHALLLI